MYYTKINTNILYLKYNNNNNYQGLNNGGLINLPPNCTIHLSPDNTITGMNIFTTF